MENKYDLDAIRREAAAIAKEHRTNERRHKRFHMELNTDGLMRVPAQLLVDLIDNQMEDGDMEDGELLEDGDMEAAKAGAWMLYSSDTGKLYSSDTGRLTHADAHVAEVNAKTAAQGVYKGWVRHGGLEGHVIAKSAFSGASRSARLPPLVGHDVQRIAEGLVAGAPLRSLWPAGLDPHHVSDTDAICIEYYGRGDSDLYDGVGNPRGLWSCSLREALAGEFDADSSREWIRSQLER